MFHHNIEKCRFAIQIVLYRKYMHSLHDFTFQPIGNFDPVVQERITSMYLKSISRSS